MTAHALVSLVLYVSVLLGLAVPLGFYMARVFEGRALVAQRALGWLERSAYRLARIDPASEMRWSQYAVTLLVFNLVGGLAVYAFQRLQGVLPLNPLGLPGVPSEVAFNTAVSFASNTNWQAYAGETTMSFLTQMLALTTQNFVSAATGIAVLVALIRGFVRKTSQEIGNFWVDMVRSTVYVLLPLSAIFSVVLVSQGVVQTFDGTASAQLVEPLVAADGSVIAEQTIALGPVASQIAIKQLGTNGGGFYNANSAHPLENPTPLSNFLELLAILLIPTALCFTFGAMVRDKRQGLAVLVAMFAIFLPLTIVTIAAEQAGNPRFSSAAVDQGSGADQAGGNMEGKEVRFGIVDSAMWAVATTAASNGSVNAMLDSFTPIGGLAPMWLIQLGEIVFGGVGSGLYGMLVYAIIAVFIAGLMVGRTPEYLGKKIEAFEMKMAALVVLFPALVILAGTALASATTAGTAPLGNPGAHGFSEMLYAFSSGAGNNGSAFGGLTVSGTFYAIGIGIAMLIGRYWVILPVLAIAGSLAKKKGIPIGAGTLPTHTPLFVLLLVGTILLVGALTFVPALALGPIVEHLTLQQASQGAH